LAAAIWWHSDPFFGVLLIVAVGLLMVAGLTAVVNRKNYLENKLEAQLEVLQSNEKLLT